MQDESNSNSRYPFTPYPNGWFRFAYSHELEAGQLKTLRFFGREFVLYRSEAGVARVLDPHCPHLGAHLGHGGEVVGESIRCPFHHWEYDGDGRCTKIPYSKRIPPRARIKSWPIEEKNGLIMVYHDRDGNDPAFELPDVPEIGDLDWTPPDIMHWSVKAHWLDMNENCVDKAHFKYIHGTLSIPPTSAEIQGHLHVTDSVFTMKVPGGEGEANLVTLDHGPGFQLVRMSGLIDTLLVNTATPIDAENTDVSFCYTVRAGGDTRKRHLAEAVVKDLKQQFEHDLPIWENKAHWERPVLCDGDGPISTYRKWYSQFI
jgi:phenylpropionate dioxygenase-like ring-hydroxylating dioxygenase large terminal subunit